MFSRRKRCKFDTRFNLPGETSSLEEMPSLSAGQGSVVFIFVFCFFTPESTARRQRTSSDSQGRTSTCGREALERTRCDQRPVVMDTSALELVGSSHAVCNACDGTRMLELTKSQNVYGL